jgi:predicted RND superfamily exporter protein
MLVRIYPREDHSSLTAVSRTVDGIRQGVNDAARAFPQFRVGVTGRPALEADEMRTTDRDSHRSEIVALSVVFIGLLIMLRSLWLALVAELSLGVGIGWTFGWATLSVGELNLLSIVFLIALIGIGMDYLIQILVAWRRESARYVRASAIWSRVFRHVSPPILTACMGAAGAFLVANLTDFRGAAQLGIIAGGGLLLCLLAGYTVLPALLTLFPAKVRKVHPRRRYGHKPPRLAGWRRLLLPAIGLLLLLAGIPLMLRSRFSPNLLALQAPNLESVSLVRKLQTWSAVVLSPDLDTLRRVRQALDGAPTVARTESMLDAYDNYAAFQDPARKLPAINWADPSAVTPDDVARIASKARVLSERLRPSAPAAASTLDQFAQVLTDASPQDRQRLSQRLSLWQQGFIAELRQMLAQLSPPPPDVHKLPAEFRAHLISPDGHYALYIHPKQDLWQQDELARFVHDVEQRVAAVPGNPGVTGIAVNVFHSTAAVAGSFYKATAYSVALIFLLVLFDLRRLSHTLLAVSVLVTGLPLLIAVMGLLGATWNFANFFGLPILIGAAHEYGVFLIHRYREAKHNPRRVWQRWDASDHALLLCAFVTCSSFAFFWALGHHEGLRSLGLVMAVGSACIYLSALLVLRPLLMWHLERHRHLAAEATEADAEQPVVHAG